MTLTAHLVSFPDGSGVLAVGFLQGLTPKPLALFAADTTAMRALSGLFAQAKAMEMIIPKYAPTTIGGNGHEPSR